MNLINQQRVIPDLMKFAENKRHNVLISGCEGCGKTYLANLYSKKLGIDDFQIVESKMQSIKESIDNCLHLNTPIVLCIENLDLGVTAVSYAILKFLEEPAENVYIVVTCRNIKKIPNTILSRCVSLTLTNMAESDLISYAKQTNATQFAEIQKDINLWKCAKSISDVDILLNLNSQQIGYFKTLQSVVGSKDSVSNIIWKLQKFPDGTATPIELVICYLMYSTDSQMFLIACHNCLVALSDGKLGTHAVLAKFAFELKYMLKY